MPGMLSAKARPGLRLICRLGVIMPLLGFVGGGTADEDLTPVVLSIHDGTQGGLRCVIILAHFFTQNPVAAGRVFELTFDRHESSGTLSEKTSGHAMPVENILCGAGNAWRDTVSDISLARLRSSKSRRFSAHCRIEARVRCRVHAGGL